VAVAFAGMTVAGMVLAVMRSAVVTLVRSRGVKRQQGKDQRGSDREQRRWSSVPQMKVIHIGSSSLATHREPVSRVVEAPPRQAPALTWLPGIAKRKPTISGYLEMSLEICHTGTQIS
jgi:hypothetical protein